MCTPDMCKTEAPVTVRFEMLLQSQITTHFTYFRLQV
jgi:hypothetical protein